MARPIETAGLAPRAKSIVGLVEELATDGWRGTMADRLASHLGDEIWRDVDRSWRAAHCERLAKAARALAAAEPKLAAFDTVLGRQTIKDEVSRSTLAVAMVDRVVSAHTQIGTFVLALRVTGIVVCELHGRINDCRCLKDLADETAPAMLKAKISQICGGYLAQAV